MKKVGTGTKETKKMTSKTVDLGTVIIEGTMKAGAMYIAEKHLVVNFEAVTARMRDIVRSEFDELMATLKDALDGNMGDAMYRQILNTYCSSWGIRAVENRGR